MSLDNLFLYLIEENKIKALPGPGSYFIPEGTNKYGNYFWGKLKNSKARSMSKSKRNLSRRCKFYFI